MMDRDWILRLVGAGMRGERDSLREYATALALASGDDALASEIGDLFATDAELPLGLSPLRPKKNLKSLKLPPEVEKIVGDFLTEVRHAKALERAKLDPRHKALLIGPPGNGKTVLAGAIAIELGIRAFMVRYDDLISKVPGETSRNLLRLFSFAKSEPTLLFFDEFDALGRERDNDQESGEMKRVVSTLLVQLDDVPSHVICMAATNHAQMLDSAIWRRFNIRIELPRPVLGRFPEFMLDEFRRFGHDPDPEKADLVEVAYRIVPDHFSDAELFTRNVMRSFVLAGELGNPKTIEQAIQDELVLWAEGQKKLI